MFYQKSTAAGPLIHRSNERSMFANHFTFSLLSQDHCKKNVKESLEGTGVLWTVGTQLSKTRKRISVNTCEKDVADILLQEKHERGRDLLYPSLQLKPGVSCDINAFVKTANRICMKV